MRVAKPISAGNLGPGERNAIGRALEIGAALLVDSDDDNVIVVSGCCLHAWGNLLTCRRR